MQFTLAELGEILESSDGQASVAHRRRALIAVGEMALKAKTHTPLSRARVRKFLQSLAAEDNNDEVEVTSEILVEVLMFAMEARSK